MDPGAPQRQSPGELARAFDRLGRSVKDVLTIADDLHVRSVGARILTGKLSGSYSPAGEGNEPADSRWNYRLVVLSRPGCPARRPWFILRP
jgi:hypothetical protein